MRMTASWFLEPRSGSPNTRLWGRALPDRPQAPLRSNGRICAIAHKDDDRRQVAKVPTCSSVTPCSTPSRTLRAAHAVAPKGAILDRVCARCHSRQGRSRRRNGLRSNKETAQRDR